MTGHLRPADHDCAEVGCWYEGEGFYHCIPDECVLGCKPEAPTPSVDLFWARASEARLMDGMRCMRCSNACDTHSVYW